MYKRNVVVKTQPKTANNNVRNDLINATQHNLHMKERDKIELITAPTNGIKIYESHAGILTSVCICVLIKDTSNIQNMIENLIKLREIFKKTFIVFVSYNIDILYKELLSNLENCLLINSSNYSEEFQLRNLYLSFFHENIKMFNLMMVIDPINLYLPINTKSFNFLENLDFTVAFANQSYKYYDIDSLIDDYKNGSTITDPELKKEQQKHISINNELIPVKSAFGGLAVYKTEVLDIDNKYTTDNHITFNLKISQKYSKMFIIPSFLVETSPENGHLYL
mgnify:CR=1 FL=1|jgi:hypothetical protein